MSISNYNYEVTDNSSSISNLRRPRFSILKDGEIPKYKISDLRAKDTNCLTLKSEKSIDLIAIRKRSTDAEDYLSED